MVLIEVEEAFRNLKGDLAVRPIIHRLEDRIEAHIFLASVPYWLSVTLRQMTRAYSPGMTPRSILEQMKSIQMIGANLPTTEAKELWMSRYPKLVKAQQLLLSRLKLKSPPQPPPEISSKTAAVVKTFQNLLLAIRS